MGCQQCTTRPRDDAVSKEENKKIRDRMDRECKILLLGTGDSGKSTVVKQLKIIHMSGFTDDELEAFTPAVLANFVSSIQCLINAAFSLGYHLDQSNSDLVESLLEVSSVSQFNNLKKKVPNLLKDKNLQKTLERKNEVYLPDSAPYFFNHCERLVSPSFVPNVEDIIRTRVKTMGINEICFEYNRNPFKVVDVGGQRSERRKWIHCFQGITAIIFCVALSEYNLQLEEDVTVNRMHESFQLFTEICDLKWFENTTLILFLNKQDLLKEKILHVPLTVCYPDAPGGTSADDAIKYLSQKFTTQAKKSGKLLYVHVTHAIDTECVKFVFDAVRDTIITTAMMMV